MQRSVFVVVLAMVLTVVPGAAVAQDLTPTALLGVDGLLDKADAMARRLEDSGGSWTRQWTDSLREGAKAVREASARIQQGIVTASAELRLAQGHLVLLIDRAEQAVANQRTCTRQDLRYLFATADASVNSIAAANVPWNRAGHFVAAGHAVGDAMRVGTKTGVPVVFELEGSYPRLAHRCAQPAARLVPLILEEAGKGQVKTMSLDVVGIDDRKVQVRVPSVSVPGLYNIQVAYATSSGLLDSCDSDWTYLSWVLPVASPNREYATVDYTLTPTCYSLESTSGKWDRELRSENCDTKQDSTTLEEGCRFTNVDVEHVNGDQMAGYEILDGGRRLVVTERSQCRDCRRRILGTCVDWLNHFGQHRFHARWACDRVHEGQLSVIKGSFTLRPGESGTHDIALPKEMNASRDGRMCRWSLAVSVTHFLNGEQVRHEQQSHAQPPPAQHPTLSAEGAQWFQSAAPTSEVGNTVTVQGSDWIVSWLPDSMRLSATLSPSVTATCGLFE